MKSSNAAIFRNTRLRDKKDYPLLAEPHERCCGCAACCAICPKNAIHMDANEEGFFYPVVDPAKCVRCYRCLDICVFRT